MPVSTQRWHPNQIMGRPWVVTRCMLWVVQGHQAGVIDVALDERNNQLISLSSDQTLKV